MEMVPRKGGDFSCSDFARFFGFLPKFFCFWRDFYPLFGCRQGGFWVKSAVFAKNAFFEKLLLFPFLDVLFCLFSSKIGD